MGTDFNYPALIDGEPGAYGVVFPDIDGVVAMGETAEEAIENARGVLADYAIEMNRDGIPLASPSNLNSVEVPSGSQLTTVPLRYNTAAT